MDKLKTFLSRFADISNQDYDLLLSHSQRRSINKGEFFVRAGNRVDQLGFLCEGIFRVYEIKEGKEVTNYFNTVERNQVVTSFKSYLTGYAATEYVEAVENAVVITISKAKLTSVFDSSHAFERLGRKLAEYNYLQAIERIDSLQVTSAASRYESFLKLYPGLINRVPHHYIASWLGVTPESLSRIRKGS